MNDRKIKYVDLNGLKCFAEELKQYLESHVLEFSIFNELKSRIEAVENQDFYKVVDELPEKGVEKLIYLVYNEDNENFLEYIWKGDKFEQLGSFTSQLSLDHYLKVEDSPFEKGFGENSAVLKGGNNQATNVNEVALGKYNISNSDTQFSIGIGASDTDRKNAVEVKQNGDVYITGIGGFTGANSDSSKSVQEVINDNWGGILIVEHSDTLSKDYVIDVYNKISDAILSGKIYTIYVDNKTDNTIYGNIQVSSIGSNNVHLSHTIMYPDGNVYIHRHTYHANGHYEFVKGTYNLKKISELETKLNEITETTND